MIEQKVEFWINIEFIFGNKNPQSSSWKIRKLSAEYRTIGQGDAEQGPVLEGEPDVDEVPQR